MKTKYHLDPGKVSLRLFQDSLHARKLIPSRVALKEKLESRFKVLQKSGLKNIGELIKTLGNKKKIESFSMETGLSAAYLTLLKREAGSYFPNPVSLGKFPGVDKSDTLKLESVNIKNSKQLFDATAMHIDREKLISRTGISKDALIELIGLSDLSRLYGVGPVFARLLFDCGITSVKSFIRLGAEEIIAIYEDKTQRKADFTANDIEFALEMVEHLPLRQENEE